MNEIQDVSTIKFVLWLSGAAITLLLTVVGFFIARIVTDVRKNTFNIGENKGAIKLVEQQQISDIQRVEQTTQLELQQLAKNVSNLTASVQTLVEINMKK